MPKYVLLLHDHPDCWVDFSPEDIQRVVEEYQAWGRGLAEQRHLIASEKLKDEMLMMRHNDGELVVDGPFSESKEVIGGFYMFNARNGDQARQLASGCPHLRYGGRIELREVDPL